MGLGFPLIPLPLPPFLDSTGVGPGQAGVDSCSFRIRSALTGLNRGGLFADEDTSENIRTGVKAPPLYVRGLISEVDMRLCGSACVYFDGDGNGWGGDEEDEEDEATESRRCGLNVDEEEDEELEEEVRRERGRLWWWWL